MTATFWDKRASKYDELVSEHGEQFEQTIAWTKPLLARTDVLLDFGCGSGEYSLELAGQADRIHGIDTSNKMIELAERKTGERQVPNVSFDAIDEFDRSLDSAGITKILALDVFHLVADPAKTLARLHDLLGPGGRLISTTPCLGDWKLLPRVFVRMAQTIGLAPRIVPYTQANLESDLASAGFRIDEAKTLIAKSATQWIVATAQ